MSALKVYMEPEVVDPNVVLQRIISLESAFQRIVALETRLRDHQREHELLDRIEDAKKEAAAFHFHSLNEWKEFVTAREERATRENTLFVTRTEAQADIRSITSKLDGLDISRFIARTEWQAEQRVTTTKLEALSKWVWMGIAGVIVINAVFGYAVTLYVRH
jgi:hypothetical protein